METCSRGELPHDDLFMPRHHIIISGTGRAGTTFLVQLFTALGLDTGFEDTASGVFTNCNAGMELDICNPKAPYVIKGPHLCDELDSILESGDVVIDHAIVPMRDLFSAAESRRDVARRTDPALFAKAKEIPGGLWDASSPENQEAVLTAKFYKLLHVLTKRDIPTTLLYFPRFIHEPDYLYEHLDFAVKKISREKFLAAFQKVSRPELVHEFRKS